MILEKKKKEKRRKVLIILARKEKERKRFNMFKEKLEIFTYANAEKLFSPPGEPRHLSTIPIIKRHLY